ncbi:MAG: hypothetical protein JG764_409 [Clostridiales bacterium]|jgi:hypothetical protein|nr:hypothetical protein [Clostridiales bacterium]
MKTKIMSTGNGAHYLKLLFAIFVALPVLGLYFIHNYTLFQIRIHDTGEIVYQKILKIGEPFTLKYIHSVTEQPVYEVFFVKDSDTLAMKEMRYDSFGANLPVGPEKLEHETTKFLVEDGYYKILYENRSFNKVPLRVGQVIADHTLIFKDGDRLRFLDVAEGGEFVEFYVKPVQEILDRKEDGG